MVSAPPLVRQRWVSEQQAAAAAAAFPWLQVASAASLLVLLLPQAASALASLPALPRPQERPAAALEPGLRWPQAGTASVPALPQPRVVPASVPAAVRVLEEAQAEAKLRWAPLHARRVEASASIDSLQVISNGAYALARDVRNGMRIAISHAEPQL